MSEQERSNELSHDTQTTQKKRVTPLLDKDEDTLELESLSYGYYAADHSSTTDPNDASLE